jgi:hypothetical protein
VEFILVSRIMSVFGGPGTGRRCASQSSAIQVVIVNDVNKRRDFSTVNFTRDFVSAFR